MPSPIIPDILPLTQAVAVGAQTVYMTDWTANFASDVVVYSRAASVAADDATQILNSTQFNVAFIGSGNIVQVTLVTPSTAGDIVTITRMTPSDRENLYANTNFTPSMLNNDFEILTLVDQQAQLVNQQIAPRYNYSALIEPVVDTILPILGPLQVTVKNSANTALIGITTGTAIGLNATNPTLPYVASARGSFVVGHVIVAADTLGTIKDSGSFAGAGSVTEIDTGLGLIGGPIITSGTISFAPILANSLWANITNSIALPVNIPFTDINTLGTITTGIWQGTIIGIAFGGTGVNSVTTTPTPSSFAGWDIDSNMSAVGFIPGYATTATASSTTVLTVGSAQDQFFTGTLNQSVQMPIASTCTLGQYWTITNNSSGIVTITSSGGNTIIALPAHSETSVTCVLTSGTSAASWVTTPAISGSGTVGSGTINDLAFYAATGNAVAALATANNGLLTTSGTGVPAVSAVGTALSLVSNILSVKGVFLGFKVITSNGSYTPTTGATNGFVICGASGGSAGGTGSSGAGNGSNGNATTFTSPTSVVLCSANAGLAGTLGSAAAVGVGGTGGNIVASVGTLLLQGSAGGFGLNVAGLPTVPGGLGGTGIFGSGVAPAVSTGQPTAAAANSCAGGTGAPGVISVTNSAGGGGSGATSYAIVTNLSGTYTFVIGAAVNGGIAGVSGFAGGNSGSGIGIVLEFA